MSGEEGELPFSRRAGKSEAAFRTISEVAEDLDVPQHVLRFWEGKFPQVKPLKRGGGRRYYRPEDVALLKRIRDLLYAEGYTIKGVQKLLKEGAAASAAAKEPAGSRELALPYEAEAEGDGDDAGEEEFDADEMAGIEDAGPGPSFGVPEPAEGEGLSPALRQELEALLEELEGMRALLQPRQR